MSVLITGGAGYIGSHVAACLLAQGTHPVIVLDNLSTGFQDAVPLDAHFVQGDLHDPLLLEQLFRKYSIETVIHLAASTVISESIQFPLTYYHNNTQGTLTLLKACVKYGVKYFIYSSTAAVYGQASVGHILETHPTEPCTPYGHSKLMSEQILQSLAQTQALNFVILRYFNVAGADPKGQRGQSTLNASHLIKSAVQTSCGLRPVLPIYGTQYATPDGTCIRDFIHVSDLANAHILALHYLKNGGKSEILNCGYGQGFSVKQVIQSLEAITGNSLPIEHCAPRPGDCPKIIADSQKIQAVLNWKPEWNDLAFIVQTALAWEKKLHAS